MRRSVPLPPVDHRSGSCFLLPTARNWRWRACGPALTSRYRALATLGRHYLADCPPYSSDHGRHGAGLDARPQGPRRRKSLSMVVTSSQNSTLS